MTLKEFNDLYLGKAIQCKTEELANEFLELADSLGFIWNSGDKLTSFNEWDVFKDKTFYSVFLDEYIIYGEVDVKKFKKLPIIEFKGENKMKLKDLKQGMVCKLRNNEVITVGNSGKFFTSGFSRFNLEDTFNEDLTHKDFKQFKDYKPFDIVEITYGNEVVFKRNESRWFVPEVDERYYFTRSYGDVDAYTNTGDEVDNKIFNTVKVFKTREEAEKRLKQQQATLSVERWNAENDVEVDVYDTNVLKCSLYYDVGTKEIGVISSPFYMYMPKQFILSSPEKANQLIKECEKELKIMFGVEE